MHFVPTVNVYFVYLMFGSFVTDGFFTEKVLLKRQFFGTSSQSGMFQPSFLHPDSFMDPSFQLHSTNGSNHQSGITSTGNSSSSDSSLSQQNKQFVPSFLDPSKFTNYGQGSGTSTNSSLPTSPNGTNPSAGGFSGPSGSSMNGRFFSPDMFMNPSGGGVGQNRSFNFLNPSLGLG